MITRFCRKQAELLKKGKLDVDVVFTQTAQDFLDTSIEELNKFKFLSRTTSECLHITIFLSLGLKVSNLTKLISFS